MSNPYEQALRNAITEAPNDPLPRLIYADWLDETGSRWGEFYRAVAAMLPLSASDGWVSAPYSIFTRDRVIPFFHNSPTLGIHDEFIV